MSKREPSEKAKQRVRAFIAFVAAAMFFIHMAFGQRIQEWYKTTPHHAAEAIGAAVGLCLLFFVCGMVWFLASRTSDS